MIMRNYYFIILLMFTVSCSVPKQQAVNNQMSGNPLFEGWYADPEALIFNNRYWIFPTFSAPYNQQIFFDAFSSTDLVNWTKHPRILDNSAIKWANRAMWHPV